MPRLTMRPDTIAGRCVAVLQEGPATTGEVAAELGMSSHLAGTHLQLLWKRGKVTRAPFQGQKYGPGPRKVWLWSAAA